jgi:hypothetical protein
VYKHAKPFFKIIFPPVKNKPYQPRDKYALILEYGAVANKLFLTSSPPREEQKKRDKDRDKC